MQKKWIFKCSRAIFCFFHRRAQRVACGRSANHVSIATVAGWLKNGRFGIRSTWMQRSFTNPPFPIHIYTLYYINSYVCPGLYHHWPNEFKSDSIDLAHLASVEFISSLSSSGCPSIWRLLIFYVCSPTTRGYHEAPPAPSILTFQMTELCRNTGFRIRIPKSPSRYIIVPILFGKLRLNPLNFARIERIVRRLFAVDSTTEMCRNTGFGIRRLECRRRWKVFPSCIQKWYNYNLEICVFFFCVVW